MNYLTMNNAYVKTHSYLSEQSPRNLLLSETRTQVTENNNQITSTNGTDKTIQEVWSKYKFETNNTPVEVSNFNKTWATESAEKEEDEEIKVEEEEDTSSREKEEETSPSHHARRPMNAFLIFCKKHRPIVRERFPNLENRGVTRILGEWWALLDETDKSPYTGLAKEYKDAFLSANPDFKWYKLPAPPLRTLARPPPHKPPPSSPTASQFNPGKLADESQLGGLTSLMSAFSPGRPESNNNVEATPPRPFKKRAFDVSERDITHQELVEQVVDRIFTKGVRKSGRRCKGKRYEEFMVEGRLGGKRPASRRSPEPEPAPDPEPEPPRAEAPLRDASSANFDLNRRIDLLPSLSYDVFHQRKRESKKRKGRRADAGPKGAQREQPVGSKKRKNKRSITHLRGESGLELLALATLAEVAANTEKINSE